MQDFDFEEMNKTSSRGEEFDDLVMLRRDLGSLIRALCRCCGPLTIYQFYKEKLSAAVLKVQAAGENSQIENWIEIEGLLFCVTELTKTLVADEISAVEDVILLVNQLPETFVALRLQATEFIIALAPLLAKKGADVNE